MASDWDSSSGLVPIAPAPNREGLSAGSHPNPPQSAMPYTCQTCAKRKVKCDKASPICSRCRKGGFECVFQEPQQRPRKRKLDDVMQKLARYESILKENGLLNADTEDSEEFLLPQKSKATLVKPVTSKTGRLLTGQGRSRYIDSHMWFNLGDDEIRHMSTDEDEDTITPDSVSTNTIPPDPLTGAFLGCQQSILHCHPSHGDAMQLWKTHTENVEPICKILHIPSTGEMVESVSQRPASASKAEECLLFSIYHCAIFSISEEECGKMFRNDRSTMIQRFHAAARQALVNASFLKTTEIAVLQAFYLYLLSSRYAYDPHTYWILTGISARIGQRIGLHRDGENLGLSPFEVELRRRLFYQIFPHDSRASQSAGIDYISLPQAWDTRPPLNINDDQIWPGMTEKPVEQKGATDMMFCLSRAYVGKRLAESGKSINRTGPWSSPDYREAEEVISAAESEVEEKFIRYCDIVNPLHFLTIGLARSGMTAMRLKLRLPKVRDQTATDLERKELFQLAQRTLDTDMAVHSHSGTSRFQWHIKPFFLWGTRDSFIFMLTTLLKQRDLLSHDQIKAAWKSVGELYKNHDELFDSRQALSMAMRCLALKAWDSWQSRSSAPEPEFIRTLRSLKKNQDKRQQQCDIPVIAEAASSNCLSPAAGVSGADDFDVIEGLEFDVDDWISWDQLLKDQSQLGNQQ
ncbi:C6 transcription factor domain-containing protein [Penicillium brasilianum]|uniref:C6 transcription factor domain-containing protein n=1 Tax=Penicillium brasilianum TaxID=104259 RepID=A0A1S9RFP9_PENBI|nr:C6 transcription factor domain-containing protein [Penicillium brasilianum]